MAAQTGLVKHGVVAVTVFVVDALCVTATSEEEKKEKEPRREETVPRSFAIARLSRKTSFLVVARERKKVVKGVIIRTQHSHESVSKDRMAHTWRALSVGRAIFPRSQTNAIGCIVALTEHQLRGCE